MSSVLDRVRTAIAGQRNIPVSEVDSDADFYDDLHLDSVDVEVVMAIEEEFGIDIPDRDYESLDQITPRSMAAYIEARHSARP